MTTTVNVRSRRMAAGVAVCVWIIATAVLAAAAPPESGVRPGEPAVKPSPAPESPETGVRPDEPITKTAGDDADPSMYHSLWRGLEERVDKIVPLLPPWRDNALRQYYVCSDKLSMYCDAHTQYVNAAREAAIQGNLDESKKQTLRALANASDKCWDEWYAAMIELEHRITEGSVRSRQQEQAKQPVNTNNTPQNPPSTGNPPPGTPPPSAGGPGTSLPSAANSPWSKSQQSWIGTLSQAGKAAIGPAFDAAIKALEAYTAAREALSQQREKATEAKEAADRQRMSVELLRLQREVSKLGQTFNDRRLDYEHTKSRVLRQERPDRTPRIQPVDGGGKNEGKSGGRETDNRKQGDRAGNGGETPATPAGLDAYIAALKRGYAQTPNAPALPANADTCATLAQVIDLANRANLTPNLIADLREVNASNAPARGEKLGQLLARAMTRRND